MEYRGKSYTVVQCVEPNTWKWTVQMDEGVSKPGTEKTRAAATTSVMLVIDKALAPKKGS
jgi:hypothetical protein